MGGPDNCSFFFSGPGLHFALHKKTSLEMPSIGRTPLWVVRKEKGDLVLIMHDNFYGEIPKIVFEKFHSLGFERLRKHLQVQGHALL